MSESEQASLDSVLSKVRKLIAVAEDPATEPHVAEAYRERADAMMLAYAITETMAEASRPAEQRTRPVIITVEIGGSSDITGYFGTLCSIVAAHCRCRVRLYAEWRDGVWHARVYGFESDARYFEFLYTTLRLHMLGVLIPKIDKGATLADNCYRLHNAGYNWLEIGEMYGWSKRDDGTYTNRHNGEIWTKFQVGGMYKRAYYRAVKARGEQPTIIAAGGTATYRRSAARGYVSRIQQRLSDAEGKREAGSELVLADRFDDLDALFREDNPELYREPEATEDDGRHRKSRPRKFVPARFNPQAYQRGVAHADTADLSTDVANATARELA